MGTCEICSREKIKVSFMPVVKMNRTFIICDECFIGFMAQNFNWDDEDAKRYIEWIGVDN